MKPTSHPMRATIVWGIISGLAYIPLSFALSRVVSWPLNLQLSLSTLLAGYAILLSRWAHRPLRSLFYPLVLLLLASFCIRSTTVFWLTALGVLSWTRSGICFKNAFIVKRLAAEIGLSLGAVIFLSRTVPAIDSFWALGVWLFFLMQALYFVLFEDGKERETQIEVEPFEKAKMAAEKILCSGNF